MADVQALLVRLARSRTATRALAAVLPLGTCALLATVPDQASGATSALVLVVWVVAGAATGDRVTGLVAALSAGAWFDFFLTEPYQRFAVSDPDDAEVVVLLLAIGLLVNEIALWGHRQRDRAARRSGYLAGVLRTAEVIADGDIDPSALTATVGRQIAEVLGASDCRYVHGSPGRQHVVLGHDGLVRQDGAPLDVERYGLPVHDETVLVATHDGRPLGHFLVTAPDRRAYPDSEQLSVAVLLADQVGSALAVRRALDVPSSTVAPTATFTRSPGAR
jgi:hypothetical protein